MSGEYRESSGWRWTAPNVARWGAAAPEKSEEEKRAELAGLVAELPAEWLDAIIRAAKHGPEILDSAVTPDVPRDPTEDDLDAAQAAMLYWAHDAINKVGAPDYELILPRVSLPTWGFVRDVSLTELAEAGGFDAEGFAAKVAEEARFFDSQTVIDADGEHWNPGTQHYGWETSTTLERALTQLLRNNGILRGPCPRCNRPEWLTKYRAPKAPGRTPLDHTYCPACVELIKREQKAESMRRSRSGKKT